MRRALLLAILIVLAGCVDTADDPAPTTPAPDGAEDATLTIRSTAFAPEEPIPTKHSCDGENVSPALVYANVTADAKTLALIMDDPDAPSGTVLHWTFWDVPANETSLEEDVDIAALGGTEGQPYRGPCPPDGEHRYFFYAYAVDGTLGLESGASVDELRAALDGRTLQEAQMFGTYCRPQAPVAGCVLPG